MSNTRQDIHALVDRLPADQLSAVAGLLKRIVPNAEIEDEEISAEEAQAVARSKEWFTANRGTSFEDLVSELGFTMEQVRNSR